MIFFLVITVVVIIIFLGSVSVSSESPAMDFPALFRSFPSSPASRVKEDPLKINFMQKKN